MNKTCSLEQISKTGNLVAMNMFSPYRILPKNTNKGRQKILNTNLDDNSHHESDVKTLQMTSKEPTNENIKPVKSEIIETNEEYFDETLHNINLQMELAMQFISNDKTEEVIQYKI